MLVLRRKEGESWLDALRRTARPWHLEDSAQKLYEDHIKYGDSVEEAAWNAAYDLDILEYEEGEE